MNKIIEKLLEKENSRKLIKQHQNEFRKQLAMFYRDTDYRKIRKRKCKPIEDNTITLVCDMINDIFDNNSIDEIKKNLSFSEKKGIKFELENFHGFNEFFLHDSFFFFYKAFMNCLSCYNLKNTGQVSWNDITAYYAAFYLAQSTNCLLGNYAYIINKNDYYFSEKVAKLITGRDKNNYRIDINTNILNDVVEISISRDKLNTHRWTWEKYNQLIPSSLKINSVYFETNIEGLMKNIDHRNKDNYSFEGYIEIQDFNGSVDDFISQFEVYRHLGNGFDDYPLDVINGWHSLYSLYKELNIKHLPIEKEKFQVLINNIISDEDLKMQLESILT